MWLDCYVTKVFIETVLIIPIMLALCLMLSENFYAQNYVGIIGLALPLTSLIMTEPEKLGLICISTLIF